MNNVVENQVMGIPVSRGELNGLKNKFNDNTKAQNFEQTADKVIDITKAVVGVAGAVATIVLAVCPFDGPAGEIITALATPALVKGVEALGDSLKDAIKQGNHMYAGTINAENGKVDIHKIIDGNTVSNVQSFSNSVNNVASNFVDVKRTFDEQKSEINRTK